MIQQLHYLVFTKGYKNTHLKVYMHLDVYCIIVNNSQIMEKAQMSITDEWLKKIRMVE